MTSPFADFTDPTTSDGRKLWELATKPLKSSFNGGKPGYPLFKAQLRNRVSQCYWESIVTFAVPAQGGAQNFNLVDNADLIPLATVDLKRKARNVILLNPDNLRPEVVSLAEKEHLQAQMLHTVLTESVSGDLEQHVAELQNKGKTYGDGPTLLKLIQDKARGKAVRSKMKNVRESIKSLSLKEHKWNITQFNDQLEALLNTLKHNEETFLGKDVADVVVNNYKLVKHKEFELMVSTELNAAEKANKDIDYEELMALGDAKYQSLVNQGIWGKRTAQEDQILALQTQVKALQAAASTSSSSSSTRSSSGGTSSNGKQRTPLPDWFYKNPDKKATMTKTVTKQGKQVSVKYHWCTNHKTPKGQWGRWVEHDPSTCNNKEWADKEKAKATQPNTNSSGPSLQANQVTIQDEE